MKRDCNAELNLTQCNCTYEPCSKKGICCECISYHKSLGQLPACVFPDNVEKTYDRSIRKFVEIHSK